VTGVQTCALPISVNPFYFDPGQNDPWLGGVVHQDMIRFAFECIDNDDPAFSAALIFRAFLEGAISDSNTAQYNTFKYLGRGETFRTYQGFERSISFSFKVFIQSRSEMLPLYQKLNQLISQVYPDYSPEYNLMRGNVVNVTIGDYIYRMPGFLESVNVTIDNSNTPWEIMLKEYGKDSENDVRQLPHMVTVQCSFKPIMDILPRKEKYLDQYVPLIANRENYLKPPSSIPSDNIPTAPLPKAGDPIITTNSGIPLNAPLAPQLFTGTPPNLQPQLSAKENPNTVKNTGPRKGKGNRKGTGSGVNYMPQGLNSGANALSPMGPGGSEFNNQRGQRGF
jgi:hypothetical protein